MQKTDLVRCFEKAHVVEPLYLSVLNTNTSLPSTPLVSDEKHAIGTACLADCLILLEDTSYERHSIFLISSKVTFGNRRRALPYPNLHRE